MEVRRTAPVKRIVPDERRNNPRIRPTVTSTNPPDSFLTVWNRAAEFCWSDDSYTECVTANSTARDALYDELRDETDPIANPFKKPSDAPSKTRKGASNDGNRASE